MASPPVASATPRAPRTAESPDRRGWLAHWLAVTAAISVASTCADATLLQYRVSYFSGGFLASDYITRPTEAIAFFAGSLLSDAAATGIVVGLVLWIAARAGAHRNLALFAACVSALAPVAIADFVSYQLKTYLGDAFDFGLMFDLAGRSPREILAVSSGHVMKLALAGGAIMLVLAAALWAVRRRLLLRGPRLRPASWRVALFLPLALLAAGITATTAMRTSSDVLDNGLRRKPTGRMLGAAVEALSDFDGDGSGILGRPPDPALFDANIRPYAVDIPGNGIDEDGVGGNLPRDIDPYRENGAHASIWRSKPDVVLIVLESFRADAFHATFDGRPVTPVLDAIAARGISARLAFSHNGYTVQSRRHIFTGSTADIRGDLTLIDDFKAHGYQTAYFSAQDESFGGAEQGIGFERADIAYDARQDRNLRFTSFSTAGSLAVPFNVLDRRIEAFLQDRHSDLPLFLYMNFQDTHFPYHHSGITPILNRTVVPQGDISPEREAALRAMYLNTAANVDRAIGEVLAFARRSLGREPGVIVLSDHGESLFDEGFLGHGYALNDVQTRIPLIVANLPLTLEEPFGQSDLRDALDAALQVPPAPDPSPRLVENPSRFVFQYLGLIRRPVQIALTGVQGRVIYDFREGKVRIGNTEWRRPDALAPEERRKFLSVVHTWERMMLARSAASNDGT